MNRKAAGIILSIVGVALIAGTFFRPSVESSSPGNRHIVSNPASADCADSSNTNLATQPSGPSLSPTEAASDRVPPQAPPSAVQASTPDPSEPHHPGELVDPTKVVARYGVRSLTTDHPDIKAAMEIQERNNRWLLAHPAVVGTAVGLNDDGLISLVVYTKVEAPELPKTVEDLPVAVYNSGPLFARHRMATQEAQGAPTAEARRGGVNLAKRFDRPVPTGVSTGHPNITAGTIGCRVTKNGLVYALSNNHVYADENNGNPGDRALQPGPYDGGLNTDADSIGTLAEFIPIAFGAGSNTVDCAIALSSVDKLQNQTASGGYGTPRSSTIAASLGQRVQKIGRTTGLTAGKVTSLNFSGGIGYSTGTAMFVGQVVITPGSFSAGGDSGSLIVVQKGTDDRKPVALLFAGSTLITIANPIDSVLSAFGVTVDGN